MATSTLEGAQTETAPDYQPGASREVMVYRSTPAEDPGGLATVIRQDLVESQGWSDWLTYNRPVIRTPSWQRNRRFIATARWEGVVTERFSTYFEAEVIDLDGDETAAAQFDLADLSDSDRHLCEPGALFYWTIGYDVKEGGQRSRASVVAFRRMGPGAAAR